MYTIIGGDGKEYGPVTTDQIRTWISAGRANLETRAKALGTDEWKQLGDFPAFAPEGAASSADFYSARPSVSGSFETAPAAQAPRLEMTVCYEHGWELLKSSFLPLVLVTLFVIVLGAGASVALRAATGTLKMGDASVGLAVSPVMFSPLLLWKTMGLSFAEGLLISHPLVVGLYYHILKRARGEKASVSDVFAGFGRVYLPLVAAAFLVTLLTVLGCFIFIFPGIYLAVAYSLTPLLIIDRKLGVWEAMEMSRRTITSHWWTMLGVFVIGTLLMFAGVMALVVGLLVAIPLFYCALIYAYLSLFPPPVSLVAPPDQP